MLIWVLVLLGVYLFMALAVFLWGDRLVFFPAKDGDWTRPAGVEDARFKAADGTELHSWYWTTPDARYTVLLCHGNAGNITDRKYVCEALRGLGVNVLALGYRGYGKSEGSPSEDGLYQDGVAAWEYLVNERGIQPSRIVVLGQSLGSSVATHVAAERECAGLILEAPMASAGHMASKVIPFPPLGWAARVRLNNLGTIGRVRCPVLIVHGTADRVIPFSQGKRVFEAAGEPKRFVVLEGGDHNDLWDDRSGDYMNAIKQFLRDLRDGE